MGSSHLSFRIWPIVAGVLSAVFITFDLHLVNQARDVQQLMGSEVRLLHGLDQLAEEVNELQVLHRVDLHTGSRNWSDHVTKVADHLEVLRSRYGDEPGMDEIAPVVLRSLHEVDSLHRKALIETADLEEERITLAVLQLILRRAERHIQVTSRKVHEQGLSVNSAQLSQRWDEAQVLMFLSCLMAVVFALLVGMTRRLLSDSRTRGVELDLARSELEQTNLDLRATMLSKEEKEVMLKEIHHRVKNNLQIVKSLIRFQMDQVHDAKTTELFNECITRVSAMALVHEQSYLSRDLASIDVSVYLDRLVRDLTQAYTIDTRLRMDVRIQVSTLGIDTLIPLGLLINEVISNALKYAFPGRSEGTIIVHLSGSESGGLHLLIGDDGVGLPSKEKWERPDSLGMELIHTLAGQLDSTVELMPGPGTRYQLVNTPVVQQRRA